MPRNFEEPSSTSLSTVRDIVAIGFRHQRLCTVCFGGILLGALLAGIFLPKYEAESKFLVKRERVDPVVSSTPEQNNLAVGVQAMVTEEELNSEIDLLTSDDLLRQVVIKCDLATAHSTFGHIKNAMWGWWRTPDQRIETAVRALAANLNATVVKKSDTIDVTYRSSDPQLAYRVLRTLDDLYLAKHTAVHRPSGQYAFFNQETGRYRVELQKAEAALADFPKQYGAVEPAQERDIMLQRLNDFQASLQQARAAIAQTKRRIHDLQQQASGTPDRITTALKHSDNPELLQRLKGTLLTLELQHVDLLAKYQPDYRPVQDVEKQIADTKAAIAREEGAPVKEVTTDLNPTHQWIQGDLAKANADLAGYEAQATALERTVAKYQDTVRTLDRAAIVQQDLLRNQKTQEENFLLYQHKREEARIADMLDQSRILNVVEALKPNVPSLPAHSPFFFGLLGALAATAVSVGALFSVEFLDSSLRTPREVEAALDIPVLAAVPYSSRHDKNGNGYGRGRQHPDEADVRYMER